MLSEVPAWKIDRWRYYESLEPFGDDRIENLLAPILMMIRNHGHKPQDMLPLDRFMQRTPIEEPRQLTPEERTAVQIANARAAAAADKARRGG